MVKKYEYTIDFTKEEFDHINKLLSIRSFDDLTEDEMARMGAKRDDFQGIFWIKFPDGAEMTYDLCSGSNNYFDDIVLTLGNNEYVPECDFELGTDIEVVAWNCYYAVHLHLI
jgi:hypothetical protein